MHLPAFVIRYIVRAFVVSTDPIILFGRLFDSRQNRAFASGGSIHRIPRLV